MRIPITVALVGLFFALTGWLQGRPSNAASIPAGQQQGRGWTNNAGSACKKLLTPDFLSAILIHPAGATQPSDDGQSCSYSSDNGLTTLKIELSDHITLDGWNQYNKKNRPTAVALAGVGDKAVRTESPAVVYAWKNGGRTCGVMLLAIDEQPKLNGEPLAKKLGWICNQLFALP